MSEHGGNPIGATKGTEADFQVAARVTVGHGKDVDLVQQVRPGRDPLAASHQGPGEGLREGSIHGQHPSARVISGGISNSVVMSGSFTATCSPFPRVQISPVSGRRISKSMAIL